MAPRHPALIPLSRDHHHGLVVALRMKKGGPASPHDLWPSEFPLQRIELLRFADSELLPHFAAEEEILFPTIQDIPTCEQLCHELIGEHNDMRKLLESIRAAQTDELPSQMKHFGAILESHIRKEERTLFPLIEAAVLSGSVSLPAETLAERQRLYSHGASC